MKNKYILLCALATIAFVGCQKDSDGALRLFVEGMGDGSKMAVEDSVAYWASGDQVRINGETVYVNINESSGVVSVNSVNGGFSAPYFGVYPAGIFVSNINADYTLNLPATYTYATTSHYSRTLQDVGAPMVAYAASGSELTFKHITGALNVMIKNDFGIDVRVTNITISSNKYQLSGTTAVAVGDNISVTPVAAEGDANAALRQVQMTFGATQLIIPCGGSAVVQVPVLPVGSDNRFTISVSVQNKDDADMNYTFSRKQGNSQSDYSLNRAQIGYAPAKFGGVFTIAPGKQVHIAPGNLQYQASTATWQFAKHQYDAIGNNAGNKNFTGTRPSQADWIDLFGWGTSGQYHGNTYYMPYETNSTANGYGPKNGNSISNSLTISNKGDWGVNAISNGGNVAAIWHTMTQGQIDTLLTIRAGSTMGGITNARYVKAKVCNIQGIIIFPDEYVHPSGVANPSHVNSSGTGGWTSNNYNATKWEKMEVAGAVFLPVTNRISGESFVNAEEGYYWTTDFYTYLNNYYAVALNFTNSNLSESDNQFRYSGCAVRLVRDVQ